MVLERPGPPASAPLAPRAIAPGEPAPGMLLLRVAACGVCRTDLQICAGDIPLHRRPIVPGHQAVGRVAAIGSGVSGWALGDRAGVAWLAGTCGVCAMCRSGRENLCVRATFTGWDVDGGYATHLAVRADFALRIPDGFDDLAAAPLLCGGVIGYRSLKRSGIAPGGRLGLYGFGASALADDPDRAALGLPGLRGRPAPRRSGSAPGRSGPEWTGGYDDPPPEPLDAAITFAPSGDVVRAALRALDCGGTVAINAIHLDRVPEFPYEELWWERRIASVANFTREDAREFLELAARIPVRTAFDTFPLGEANVALDRLARGEVRGAAVLVV